MSYTWATEVNQKTNNSADDHRNRVFTGPKRSTNSWIYPYYSSAPPPPTTPHHQPHGCLLNRLFGRRSKKTSKLRVTGLCAGNSPGPVNSLHKGPVTRKMFPFDDVIMLFRHSPECSKIIEMLIKHINDIKNNAWVAVNNDFLVTSEVICQWFSRVTKSRVKIIGKSPHEWLKIVIHGNECIILFLTRYFMSWTHHSAKNYHRSPLSLRTVFFALALWRHHIWSVTSRERGALALWRHIHRLFSYARIRAKAIFTCE